MTRLIKPLVYNGDEIIFISQLRTCICIYYINLVPSCYVNTNCNGNPIGNVATTFSECCTILSGVSFELERQCRMCPTSG